ncbi:MAG: hypothetical protein R3C18_17630 [Planctomycetaceae bacterium]
MVDVVLVSPQLPERIAAGTLSKPFLQEFAGIKPQKDWRLPSGAVEGTSFGTITYDLPVKWQDRIERMQDASQVKQPQTVQHWHDAYLGRVDDRAGKLIDPDTAKDRRHKLRHFRENVNLSAHITTLDNDWVESYELVLDDAKHVVTGKPLGRKTKMEYMKAVRMFLRWAASKKSCELELPTNLSTGEHSFREPEGTGRVH